MSVSTSQNSYLDAVTAAQMLELRGMLSQGKTMFVDGTNGSDANNGYYGWANAKATIQAAVTACAAGDVIYIAPKLITDFTGDPTSYAETIIIPATKMGISLIGISRGRTQGGLPQIKPTSTASYLITVRAAGCMIANLGINGINSTAGGILLDDDNSTKTAFGTTIINNHFKNCVGSSATNAATGGAINWCTAGNAWQVYIGNNRFQKNVGDIVLLGTSNTVPQDVIIENNVFSGPAASVDCNLYLAGGSGMNGVIIQYNTFPCWPAVGSGTNVMPVKLTGCVGTLQGNMFGCTGKTFGAAANALVPATVLMAGNYQESGTTFIART